MFTFKRYCELFARRGDLLFAGSKRRITLALATFISPVSCRLGRMALDMAPLPSVRALVSLTGNQQHGAAFTSVTSHLDATLSGDAPMTLKVHIII